KYVGVLGQPGGTGKWPAVVDVDPTLQSDVLYHPVKIEGQLPIVIFAPGGCRNDGLYPADILKEIASHGYMILAIALGTNGRGEQEVIPGTEQELFNHGALPEGVKLPPPGTQSELRGRGAAGTPPPTGSAPQVERWTMKEDYIWQALDWAKTENERPGGAYYGKLNV